MTASTERPAPARVGHLRQMLTYAVVGVINTLVGGGTTFATIPLLGAYWANVCGYAIGLCVSYLLNSRFTFTGHRAPGALPRFWLGFALAYGLNLAVLRLLEPSHGAYWANAGGIVTYTVAFFLIQKFYVFRPPDPEAGPRTWLTDLGRAALLLLASRVLMLAVLLIHGSVTGTDCWSAWFQFDANWYADVAAHGYLIAPRFGLGGQANWAFFPLYPLLSNGLARILGLSIPVAATLLTNFCAFGCIYLLLRLGRDPAARFRPRLALVFFLFGPYSFYHATGYTEPLFFLLLLLAWMQLRAGHPLRSGLCALLLSATRAVGVFFCVLYAVEMVRTVLRLRREGRGDLRTLVGALMPLITAGCIAPLGLFAFMHHLHGAVGDAMAFSHVQVAWGRSIGNPLAVLAEGLTLFPWKEFYFAIWYLVGIWACVHLARRGRIGLALFFLIAITIPLSTSLISMPRYVGAVGLIPLALGLREREPVRWRFALYTTLLVLCNIPLLIMWCCSVEYIY